MTETLQIAGLPRQGVRKQTAAALTALGVVYGDIGTSTLYGLKQAVEAAGAPTPDTVMGIVSLILWALLLIVALKYAILILRADNHGEGGIVARCKTRTTRELACLPAHRWFDRGCAALWRRRDHAGDLGTQRYRRSQDRRAGTRANGCSYHHRNPG